MDVFFAYVTVPSAEEGRRIGKILIEERLSACINILPQMESWYTWNDTLENAQEAVLIIKTTSDFREALQRRVLELHPYECPCVVFLPVVGGNPAYLEWIRQSTGKESS
jgi:periplasmic divalent cation tolerance protein